MVKNLKLDNDLHKLNILIAFPYFSKGVREELLKYDPNDYNLIVDSGAFSAYNSGHIITLDDYCNFLTSLHQDLPAEDFHAVQLDVVYNEQGTIDNYKEMLNRGFDPCPVFTRGSDPEYFKQLLRDDKYVFVGGVQRGKGAPNFAKWVLENSGDYTQDRVHMLAFVRPDFINHYKPYSVDSSSWTSAARYGQLMYFKGGRLKSITKKDFAKKPKQEFLDSMKMLKVPYDVVKKLRFSESWINTPKFDYDEDPSKGTTTMALFINTLGYVYYSVKAQEKIGTKIYMAIGDTAQIKLLFKAYNYLKERGVI